MCVFTGWGFKWQINSQIEEGEKCLEQQWSYVILGEGEKKIFTEEEKYANLQLS